MVRSIQRGAGSICLGAALFVPLVGQLIAAQAPEENLARAAAPLLAAACLECHNASDHKGGLDLTSQAAALKGGESGPALVAGSAARSLAIEKIREGEMPPKRRLPPEETDILSRWIDAGAPYEGGAIDRFRYTSGNRAGYDWWSLRELPRESPLPRSVPGVAARNAIDLFINEELARRNLEPLPEASPRHLVRRLYFDLIGLPPSPETVAAFVADGSEQAYEKLVDELLASPQFGVRYARHWLDVARYGESDGFERNAARPHAWPYRDWVVDAFNADLPYDQFARAQIAGDVLPAPENQVAATGFLVAGIHNTVVGGNALAQAQARHDELEEIIGTYGQAFLGMTVHCARCHDHKFDPVSQQDYYALVAALVGVTHGERELPAPPEDFRLARRAAEVERELTNLEQPVREALLQRRDESARVRPAELMPLARWSFDHNLRDERGSLHGTAQGAARISEGQLQLDGQTAFVGTLPLARNLREKTLAVTVRLATRDQAGGGAMSVQTLDGNTFDAVVFGEREANRWMAGSEFYRRSQSFQADEEREAHEKPVHFAIVYRGDGTLQGFRNGLPYGKPYATQGPVTFEAGKAQVVFGLRHSPAGGNRLLRGAIDNAELFERALSDAEVAVVAATTSGVVSDEELAASFTPEVRADWQRLRDERTRLAALLLPPASAKVHAVAAGAVGPVHVFARGNPALVRSEVLPGAVAALLAGKPDFGLPASSGDAPRRQRLAEWTTSPANPLFARVMANRLWHWHFGVGLVETPSDFGFNGGRPSHPALLDFLAGELVAGEYRLKRLHRLIVTSAAYRRRSVRLAGEGENAGSAQAWNANTVLDAGNRWLWRANAHRLEAEVVRDALLCASGELNWQLGGPGFRDTREYHNSGTTFYEPIDPVGPDFQRRTLYRFSPRGERSALLDAFDCPDPSAAAARRQTTTTPVQALALLNGGPVLRMSSALATRVTGETAGSEQAVHAQIERMFALTLARPPEKREAVAAETLVRQHGLAALARALFNCNEFVIIE